MPKGKDDDNVQRQELTAPEYEKLGRMIQQVYETAYANKKRLLFLSFLQGIARGFGTVVGATVVVGLLLWLLSLLGEVPFLDAIVDSTQETLQEDF